MVILGIDLGSRSVKIAIMENGRICFRQIFDTSYFYRNYCSNIDKKLNIYIENLYQDPIDKIISTGYGRNNVDVSNSEKIIEVKAHAYGAIYQTDLKNLTLLDIGGQDSKVISIKNGRIVDIALNDKCAASCGRYLENMAQVLGIDFEEIQKHYMDPVPLNSTCAVFSESELIGKISEGYSLQSLAAGVNYSLFRKVRYLIEKFPQDVLVVSGGVAKNNALIKFIQKELSFKDIVIPNEPQLNAAIGCCIFGMK